MLFRFIIVMFVGIIVKVSLCSYVFTISYLLLLFFSHLSFCYCKGYTAEKCFDALFCQNYSGTVKTIVDLVVWRNEVDRDRCIAMLRPRHPMINLSEPKSEPFDLFLG